VSNLLPGAAISALALYSQPVLAEEDRPPLDEIIVVGSWNPIEAEDASAAVSVIDAEAIGARGAPFVTDYLRSVPGIAVSRSGGPGALTQLRLRGAEANQTVVLIDGIEAASPFTGEFEFANLTSDDIARIEVLRGEQSALWGASAIGGVINIVSEDRPGAAAQLEAGSFETIRASAALGGDIGEGFARGFVSAYSSDGIDVSERDGETDGYENVTVGLRGAYPVAGDQLTIRANLRRQDGESQSDPDTDFDGRLDNADRLRETVETYGNILADGAFANGVFYRGSVAMTLNEADNFAEGAFTDASMGRRWDSELILGWEGEALGATHRITGLVEREEETFKNRGAAPGAGQNQKQSIETDAIAAEYRLRAGPAGFDASIRHEENDRFDDAVTWRIGGLYAFDAIGGRARASLGEGVTNPGVFELFGFFPDFFVGNPELQPERSEGWEIGWDQSFESAGLTVSATWFSATLTDEIFTDFAVFPSTARNRATESEREGLELEAVWTPSDTLRLNAAATWLDTDEAGQPEIRRPDFTASAGLDWQASERVRLGLFVDHVGEQLDTDFGTFQTVTLDAYTLVDARLGYAFSSGVEAWVRAENLLDEDYVDVFGFNTPGAAGFVGLSWRR